MLKPLWAAAFGIVLILAIAGTSAVWDPGWGLARYDALLLVALATQALFLALRLETAREALAVLAFAALSLGMELYKVGIGSWAYPGPGALALGGVPLFVGFMYAAVGLFIVRMIRVFEMDFIPFPPPLWNGLLAGAIYLNFFTMHHLPDLRYGLIVLTVLAYARSRLGFRAFGRRLSAPFLLALILAAGGVWLVENLGTLTGTWLYAGQRAGEPVALATLGSWYLFLTVALALALAFSPEAVRQPRP